jgi:hypothetical protein
MSHKLVGTCLSSRRQWDAIVGTQFNSPLAPGLMWEEKNMKVVTLVVFAGIGLSLAGGILNAATIDAVSLNETGPQQFSANSTSTVFSLTALQPAGSGIFNPFVRIHGDNGSNADGIEQGYNSVRDQNFTLNDINLPSSSPIIPVGTALDQNGHLFLTLDYGEPGNSRNSPNDSLLVLKDLQVIISARSDIQGNQDTGVRNDTATTPQPFVPSGANDFVEAYRMSKTTANSTGNQFEIWLNANNNNATGNGGNGQADLNVDINLLSFFQANPNLVNNHYFYVWSLFGDAGGSFEEWRVAQFDVPFRAPPVVPLPAAVWSGFSALGALGLLGKLRRRQLSA